MPNTVEAPEKVQSTASAKASAKKAKKGKKEKRERVEYITVCDESIVTVDDKDERLLNAVPTDFNPREHKPLRRTDFVNEADFVEFRGQMSLAKSAQLQETGERLIARAASIRQFGDGATRAKAEKANALLDRLSKVLGDLQSDGADISSLDSQVQALVAKIQGDAA